MQPAIFGAFGLFAAGYAGVYVLAGHDRAGIVTLALLVATILVEILAVAESLRARGAFAPDDPSSHAWLLIAGFLSLRILAELRYVTILAGIVPGWSEDASPGVFFFVVVLRYLFTLGDLLLIAALVTMIRSYRAAGLEIRLRPLDVALMSLVSAMALVTALRPAVGVDGYLLTYWKVAALMSAIIGVLCVILLRLVGFLGTGALAMVWRAVLIACTLRIASLLSTAILTRTAPVGVDEFVEQALLWIFAGWWLVAALGQRTMFDRLTDNHP